MLGSWGDGKESFVVVWTGFTYLYPGSQGYGPGDTFGTDGYWTAIPILKVKKGRKP